MPVDISVIYAHIITRHACVFIVHSYLTAYTTPPDQNNIYQPHLALTYSF